MDETERENITTTDCNTTECLDNTSTNPMLSIYIGFGIVVPILVILGLIGNGLTAYVLWHNGNKNNVVIFLKALLIADTSVLICAILINTPLSYAYYKPTRTWLYFRYSLYPFVRNPADFIFQVTKICNIWITVFTTLERYLSICHPFHIDMIVTKKRCYLVNVCVLIIAACASIPHVFSCQTVPCSDRENAAINENQSPQIDCYVSQPTAFGKTREYAEYRRYSRILLFHTVPLVIISVANAVLIKELVKMSNRQEQGVVETMVPYELELSVSLVIIVIVFVICQTPNAIMEYKYRLKDEKIDADYFTYLAVSGTLLVANSSVNCIIYTACGRKFRRSLARANIRLLQAFRLSVHSVRSSSDHSSNTIGRKHSSRSSRRDSDDLRTFGTAL